MVINGAGGSLGGALAAHFAADADTDLVLSDVSQASLDATVAGLPESAGPSRPCSSTSAIRPRSRPSSPSPSSASAGSTP